MEQIQSVLRDLARPDAPLAYAGAVAAGICALWLAATVAWLVRRAVRRVRSVRSASAAAESTLPQLASSDDLRVLRHTIRPATGALRALDRPAQIEPNQSVRISVAGGTFNTFVLDAADDELHVALPMAAVARKGLSTRKDVRVSFTRPDDARYTLTSRVVAGSQKKNSVVLHATTALKRHQERKDFRVRCRTSVRIGRAKGTLVRKELGRVPLSLEGRFHEISIGGASLICDDAIESGTRIVVAIETGDAGGTLRLAGRVLRQKALTGTSVRKFRTSVEFPALSAVEERRLGRFVTACQQDLIRRMGERAGTTATPLAARQTATGADSPPMREPARAGYGMLLAGGGARSASAIPT